VPDQALFRQEDIAADVSLTPFNTCLSDKTITFWLSQQNRLRAPVAGLRW
jgi:hypothetical protein